MSIISRDVVRLAALRRIANAGKTVPSTYLKEVLDAYEKKFDKRDEIEDVLAVLSRDIDTAATNKYTFQGLEYARHLREYLRRGAHHGMALKYEAEMEDEKCTTK